MSATRMMIIGLVQWMQPVHDYDVRRELRSWSADKWANVQPGSVYQALRKLSEKGMLREVATEQVGARPARTTLHLLACGRRRGFVRWRLRKRLMLWAGPSSESPVAAHREVA